MKRKLKVPLIIIFATVLLYSSARIAITEIEYKRAKDIYENSQTECFHISEELPLQNSREEDELLSSCECFPNVHIDLEELKSTNSDIKGWIWVPDTNINYPLLRGDDNSKYLKLSYNLQQTSYGSIFMDYRSSPDFCDDNTVVYGHNMNNGGMFGSLKKYSETEYLEEHCYIYLFTEDRILKYRIFAAYRTESGSKSYTMKFSDDMSYSDYIEYVMSCGNTCQAAAPSSRTPILTLSTCTSVRRSERFVVHAVLIAEKGCDEDALAT